MTQAGQPNTATTEQAERGANQQQLAEAINQVFAIFRINYHNQYFAAFADTSSLNQAKKLWIQALNNLPIDSILTTAKNVVEHSEYLPTLKRFKTECEQIAFQIPSIHDAYLEACNATGDKLSKKWSHPLVYHAGKACGWQYLQSQPEKVSFRLFEEKYSYLTESLCRNSNLLSLPAQSNKPAKAKTKQTMSDEDKQKKMNEIKALLTD